MNYISEAFQSEIFFLDFNATNVGSYKVSRSRIFNEFKRQSLIESFLQCLCSFVTVLNYSYHE